MALVNPSLKGIISLISMASDALSLGSIVNCNVQIV